MVRELFELATGAIERAPLSLSNSFDLAPLTSLTAFIFTVVNTMVLLIAAFTINGIAIGTIAEGAAFVVNCSA